MPADDVPALTRSQTKVLVVLRSEARALNNNELEGLGGVRLTGKDNVKLEALGLVETDRSHRPYSHILTARGVDVAGQLDLPEPPRPSKPSTPQYDPDVPKFSSSQLLALVVLMSEARQLNNTELKALAGFSLTGADNKKLEKTLGLVDTDRSHAPYSHQLTEKGWGLVRKLHMMEPPTESKSATRTLLTLLRSVDRSLDQLQSTYGVKLSHGEFFRQQRQASEERVVEGADPESRVRKAYALLAGQPGDWVGLADLRDQLRGLTRAEVDAALMALLDQDGVRIIPVANTKALNARDRAAAIDIGGEASHALSIGRS
jgi:hypothetical protein